MENKDMVPAESSKDSETTPLVVEEKEAVETSQKATPVTTLASDLSELSVEDGGKVTSSNTLDAEIDAHETAIEVPSSNCEGGQSVASTDVEQSSKTEITGAKETAIRDLSSNSEGEQSGSSTDAKQPETEITGAKETEIKVPSSNSEEDRSGTSTDVEQSETEITDSQETALITDSFVTAVQTLSCNSERGRSTDVEQQLGADGTRERRRVREFGYLRRPITDPEIREGHRRFFDNTMWWLLIDFFMICFPVCAMYFAVRFAGDCVDGDKLPVLLTLASFMTFLVLVGRIARNLTKKFSRINEEKMVPSHIIVVGDLMSSSLLTAQMAYFYTIRQEGCSHELHSYACFYGITSLCILGIIYLKMYLNRGY